jgi:sarcosine oxidase subunit gamma
MYHSLLTAEQNARTAHWQQVAGNSVIADFGESDAERVRAFSQLALVDLSPLPRAGIKGNGLSRWMDARRYVADETSNRAYVQRDEVLIARLSPGELMLLSNPADPSIATMTHSIGAIYKCYPVRRQDSHYWFALTGTYSPSVLAKLCGVNLSPAAFADNTVAQTSVARANAVVIRHDINDVLCYYLLGDSSMILYMWTCIIDAMDEFDGQILGLRALGGRTNVSP